MIVKKPPVLTRHKIMEIVGYAMLLLALIISIVVIATGHGDKIPMHVDLSGNVEYAESPALFILFPIMMVGCGLMTSFALHLLPMDMFNMPFKVKEEYRVMAYYVGLDMICWIHIIFAAFTLAFVSLFMLGFGESVAGASTVVMCIAMTVAIIVAFVRDYKLSKL